MPENATYKIVTVARQPTAVVKTPTPMNKIPDAERSARAKLAEHIAKLAVGTLGKSFTLWHMPVDGMLYMEPGVVVAQSFVPAGGVEPSELPAGRAVHFLLVGPYDGLPGAWSRMFEWCASEKLNLAGVNWQL